MTLIASITEMRDTSKMFQLSGNQPVFITKNGYGSRVLINIDHYNRIKDVLRTSNWRRDTEDQNTKAGMSRRMISSRGSLMSDYHVELSVDAQNDIVSICDYIRDKLLNISAAERFLRDTDDAITSLERFP
jgi:PHD/YefM family antitoxin component YafN of YafNO toxin-antitoxin module